MAAMIRLEFLENFRGDSTRTRIKEKYVSARDTKIIKLKPVTNSLLLELPSC